MVDLYAQGRLKLDELSRGNGRSSRSNAAIADTNAGQARRNVLIFR